MVTLRSFSVLFLYFLLARAGLAEEFTIGPYRAYSLMGEAKLSANMNYVSFTGDSALIQDWEAAASAIERHLAFESNLLSNFSLRIINMEGPLPGSSGRDGDRLLDPVYIRMLRSAGYNLISFSNNHVLDNGAAGVRYTESELKKAGLPILGTRSSPFYEWNVSGKTIAIYALTQDSDREDRENLLFRFASDDIAFFSQKLSHAAFRIAFVHLGSMSRFISPHERSQVQRLLDSGADLVVCTGSHFIKGFAMERGKPVVYGIGNHFFQYGGEKDTEPIGMHFVAGFKSALLQQLFVVPSQNDIGAKRTGPLDKEDFATFVRTLSERSTTDTRRYFSDVRTLERLETAILNFKVAELGSIKPRYLVYAVYILFEHYPLLLIAGFVFVLSIPAATLYGIVLYRKRH